jgi:hypothetical protein
VVAAAFRVGLGRFALVPEAGLEVVAFVTALLGAGGRIA